MGFWGVRRGEGLRSSTSNRGGDFRHDSNRDARLANPHRSVHGGCGRLNKDADERQHADCGCCNTADGVGGEKEAAW